MSNPIRKMFETDKSVEKEGLWIEYAPGVEIRIARAGGANKRFSKTMKRLSQPYRRALQTNTLDEGILLELFIKGYSRAVILDWKGFTKDLITHDDADADTVLDLNQENCEAVLREQPDLFTDIQKAGDDISLFRAEINEVDSKN